MILFVSTGTPSDELELYLLQKLTVNDLKKFGNSIELSYSTIQKLVLKQLNIVGQNLTYYLSELRGLTRIPDRYQVRLVSTFRNAIAVMSRNKKSYLYSNFSSRFWVLKNLQ